MVRRRISEADFAVIKGFLQPELECLAQRLDLDMDKVTSEHFTREAVNTLVRECIRNREERAAGTLSEDDYARKWGGHLSFRQDARLRALALEHPQDEDLPIMARLGMRAAERIARIHELEQDLTSSQTTTPVTAPTVYAHESSR